MVLIGFIDRQIRAKRLVESAEESLRPIASQMRSFPQPLEPFVPPTLPSSIADVAIDGNDREAVGGFRSTLWLRSVASGADELGGNVLGDTAVDAVDAKV